MRGNSDGSSRTRCARSAHRDRPVDGFAILGAWLILGAIALFYRLTTDVERWSWSRMLIGWIAVGIALTTIYELATLIFERLLQ